MSESEHERLARLRAWLSDLDQLIGEAARAQDKVAVEAAQIMRSECERFIAEAQEQVTKEGP